MNTYNAADRHLLVFVKRLVRRAKKNQRSQVRAASTASAFAATLVAALGFAVSSFAGLNAAMLAILLVGGTMSVLTSWLVVYMNQYGANLGTLESAKRNWELAKILDAHPSTDAFVECIVALCEYPQKLNPFVTQLERRFPNPEARMFSLSEIATEPSIWSEGRLVEIGWTRQKFVRVMRLVMDPANTPVSIPVFRLGAGCTRGFNNVFDHGTRLLNTATDIELCAKVLETIGNERSSRILFMDLLDGMVNPSVAQVLDAATATTLALDKV